jgi:hypothetical protein
MFCFLVQLLSRRQALDFRSYMVANILLIRTSKLSLLLLILNITSCFNMNTNKNGSSSTQHPERNSFCHERNEELSKTKELRRFPPQAQCLGKRQRNTASPSTLRQKSTVSQSTERPVPQAPQHSSTSQNVATRGYGSGSQNVRKFEMGLDYGTTYSSIAYIAHEVGDDMTRFSARDLGYIMNWKCDYMDGLRKQVPSECWYPRVPLKRKVLNQCNDNSSQDIHEDDYESLRNRGRSAADNMIDNEGNLENSDDEQMDNDDSAEYLHGYEVLHQLHSLNTTRNPNRRVPRAKLMLVNSSYTQKDRKRLRSCLERLIKDKIIRKHSKSRSPNALDVQDVITDYIIRLIEHTKEYLEEHEGYTTDCPVSWTLSVPTIWSPKASRVLQVAVESAIQATNFGTLENGSVRDLFIVSEPEAAATYLLENSRDILVWRF